MRNNLYYLMKYDSTTFMHHYKEGLGKDEEQYSADFQYLFCINLI